MPKNKTYVEGFAERLEEACIRDGRSKVEIARLCGFDRKALMRHRDHMMMDSGNLAKFCNLTKTDANWLLGVKL